MEAVRDFMDLQGTDRGADRGADRGTAQPAVSGVDAARDGLRDVSSTPVQDAACAPGRIPATTLRPLSGPAKNVGAIWQSDSMEAVRDFMDLQGTDRGADRGTDRGTDCGTARPAQPAVSGVDEARDGVRDVGSTPVQDAARAPGRIPATTLRPLSGPAHNVGALWQSDSMEAVRDFMDLPDTERDVNRGTDRGTARPAVSGVSGVDEALAVLRDVSSTAAGDAAFLGFQAASDFAGTVEELSRVMEFLQLVAAAAVDRTRKQAAATAAKASTSWTTGWRKTPAPGADAAADGPDAGSAGAATPGAPDAAATGDGSIVAVDDGYRNTTEFLRARLRIGAAEARRRLSLAETLLPRQGFTGGPLPAVHGELGAAVAAGEVASRPATIITLALDRVRHVCDAEAAARMEHALTRTAAENDTDFLTRVARSWTDALDQDGAEPSEELLRQLQGAFIRKPRHGLQHLEIFATAEQFEHLLTVMNTATNPRTPAPEPGTDAAAADATLAHGAQPARSAEVPAAGDPVPWAEGGPDVAEVPLDLRSRPQKLLDGLVGACKAALAAGTLPAAGGLRPQVMVTIDYRDLLARLGHVDGDLQNTAAGPVHPGATTEHTGNLLFTGPVTASTVRKIACDADIIPVLLGSEGRVLDIGRASRVFPPHIRKALTARDQGCTFPGCTIPAPWCEAHHITELLRRFRTAD
ncbi:HNH endonuclease signature motif containing protein [Arthrobacter sp. SO3]|uniref:HNH endonuclease signature motif containing protein n=1 Tax=Arthrobacter sp. SO3 TaxID=1897057 RepID=UPI001D000CCE|nr:HNH endonuclease signature motif containing protein [Arthrobacter sp. SO3]MCB5292486.1 hypothetical protein [Arthrobacter sp. SO3]